IPWSNLTSPQEQSHLTLSTHRCAPSHTGRSVRRQPVLAEGTWSSRFARRRPVLPSRKRKRSERRLAGPPRCAQRSARRRGPRVHGIATAAAAGIEDIHTPPSAARDPRPPDRELAPRGRRSSVAFHAARFIGRESLPSELAPYWDPIQEVP